MCDKGDDYEKEITLSIEATIDSVWADTIKSDFLTDLESY